MKRNILLIADGDIQSDLDVIDAAACTGHGLRRASAHSRASQILQRRLESFDVIVVDLDKHGHTLSILEALGASESSPPVIVLTTPDMVPVAYQHGATACVAKPFDAAVLASVIGNLCAHAHPFAPEHLPGSGSSVMSFAEVCGMTKSLDATVNSAEKDSESSDCPSTNSTCRSCGNRGRSPAIFCL